MTESQSGTLTHLATQLRKIAAEYIEARAKVEPVTVDKIILTSKIDANGQLDVELFVEISDVHQEVYRGPKEE